MQQVNTENMYARMTECAVLIAVVLSLREGGLNFTRARKKKKKVDGKQNDTASTWSNQNEKNTRNTSKTGTHNTYDTHTVTAI